MTHRSARLRPLRSDIVWSHPRGKGARDPMAGRAARGHYHKRAARLGAALRMVAGWKPALPWRAARPLPQKGGATGSRTSHGRGLEARAPRAGRAATTTKGRRGWEPHFEWSRAGSPRSQGGSRGPYHKRAARLGAALRMVADTNAENMRGQAIDMQTPKRPTP